MRTSLEHGWFFAPNGELRACTIITVGSHRVVRDDKTGLHVDVRPEDVLPMGDEPEPPERE